MIKLNITPLSVNKAWQGRRFKTKEYLAYEKACLLLLPKIELPKPPYHFNYEFGFSQSTADLANPEKLITDIICKKYNIDDRHIYKMVLERKSVKKGDEYLKIEILQYFEPSNLEDNSFVRPNIVQDGYKFDFETKQVKTKTPIRITSAGEIGKRKQGRIR